MVLNYVTMGLQIIFLLFKQQIVNLIVQEVLVGGNVLEELFFLHLNVNFVEMEFEN